MRTLRVIGGVDPAFGGPSVSAIESCIAAQRAGVHVTIAFAADTAATGQLRARLEAEGVDVVSFPLLPIARARSRRWGVSPELTRWLFRNAGRFDVVHTHGSWTFTTLCTGIAALIHRRPAVLTPHETLTSFDLAKSRAPSRLAKRLVRVLYTRVFQLMVAASVLERDESGSVAPSRWAVLYHPVPAAGHIVRRPLHDDRLTIGFLGRPDPKKNLDLLLEALALLPAEARLRVAGVDPEAAPDAIEARVEWLGFVGGDEKERFLDSIDVLAMPSSFECFGVAAAEALAAGAPVVVSDRTGLAELVAREACGLVVGCEVRELAAALRRFLADPELLRRCAARTEAARAELSHAAHGAALRREYERLLVSAAAGHARSAVSGEPA
ncbi:MAG TPA: glycosyltransferase [Gaiellaceae bacterium]|nr:glycosyltransferase [Gaiellaceae bacterium]